MIRLPLFQPAGRARVTCEYRCGDQCAHEESNPTDNPYFGDVVSAVLDRRGLLKAAAVVGVAAGAGVGGATAAAAAPTAERGQPGRPGRGFTPVAPNTLDEVVVPEGYRHSIVIRWGDPLFRDAPAFDFDNQTAAAQERQFGFNCDFAALLPLDRDERELLLVTNHEYTSETFMFRGYDPATATEEQARIGWAAHGMSVVHVRASNDGLKPTFSRYNRRITLNTEFRMTGPAAGSELLKTPADPTGTKAYGTINNCAGGLTPWGTVLSGEENFNQYFANGATVTDPVKKARLARYGMAANTTTQRGWERYDSRWDIARQPNESHRFGWIVEIDPNDPTSTPVKHTAMGRFKHEGANVRVTREGRVVAYMGDDERFEYLYKFVSRGKVRPGTSSAARRHNMTLLDDGTLYVARLTGDSPPAEIDGTGALPSDGEFDGAGRWIALASGKRSYVEGMTAEEVYVFTRQAADKVVATRMDRPEDVEPSPRTGRVYAALTNNVDRGKPDKEGATEPNPRVNNRNGHVLELGEHRDDATGTEFGWRLFLVCGDPASPDTYFAGFDKSRVSPISCPDNLAFDREGNLWVSTDGNALGSNDGLFKVPTAGRERGHVRQFLTVPRGAETCGPVIRERLVTVCVQHPGEVDGASADNPVSNWPDRGTSQPRPSVVAVWKPGRHGRPEPIDG